MSCREVILQEKISFLLQILQIMTPHPHVEDCSLDILRNRLDQMINMKHQLVILSKFIDWQFLEEKFASYYKEEGRPGVTTRLIVGIHLLKHIHKLSDEQVCARWEENPYFQYFCGESFFQHKLPMSRSSMSHWRGRVGEEAVVVLLQETLAVAARTQAMKVQDLDKIVVDTTVQPKAITYPTEAKLTYTAMVKLVECGQKLGLKLRQSYKRVAKRHYIQVGRYRHAKQMKRASRSMKKLRVRLGRLIRDIQRKALQSKLENTYMKETLEKAQQIYKQKPGDKGYLLSWHAKEVECIGKGKAHKPYEFGVKVSISTTLKASKGGQFVVHAKAMPGKPYDGHTLGQVIEEYKQQIGKRPECVYVDKGYVGYDKQIKAKVYKTGQRKGVQAGVKKELKRRSVVEAVIAHLKTDGHLGRNWLKGQVGDKMNTLLSAVGQNLRLLLRWLKKLFLYLYVQVNPAPLSWAFSLGVCFFILKTNFSF